MMAFADSRPRSPSAQHATPAPSWATVAFTFGAVFITGFIGLTLPRWGAHFPLPILPSGIAVAVTYRWGRPLAAVVFAAVLSFELATHQSVAGAFTAAVGFSCGGLLTAWLLERNRFEPSFRRPKDVLIFLLAVLAGMIVTPTLGLLGFLLAGTSSDASSFTRWVRWWSNGTGGVMLLAPAAVAVSRQSLKRFLEQWAESLVWTACVVTCCSVVMLSPTPVGRSIVVMAAILLVVFAAIRFGLVVSSLGTLAFVSVTNLSFVFGFGMFSLYSEFAGRLTLFAFTTTLIGASLIVTALLAERDLAAGDRLRAEHRYAQIFDGSPQAIWVHDPFDLSFLLVNDAAQRQYGWTRSELLARNVSSLMPPGEPHVLPRRGVGTQEEGGPFETRHIAKDGRIIEVEVWVQSIDLGGRPAELVFAVDVSERRIFGRALVDALAGEQRRIAREIHDGLGQELTGLSLSLRALATRAARHQQPDAADLDDLAKLATRCIEGSKRIVQGLSPLNDAGGSLESALSALARRASLSGTLVRFTSTGDLPLTVSPETLDHFYRVAQEAVQNALTHSAARTIDIELRSDQTGIQLRIVDDGRGLPSAASRRRGLGMQTMHFRARAIGGTLSIVNGAGGGVTVCCDTPRASSPLREKLRVVESGHG